jgi:hypothetical protein
VDRIANCALALALAIIALAVVMGVPLSLSVSIAVLEVTRRWSLWRLDLTVPSGLGGPSPTRHPPAAGAVALGTQAVSRSWRMSSKSVW